MDEIYFWTRTVVFLWGSILFIGLIYWGTLDLIINKSCGHSQVPPEHQLWAGSTLAAISSLIFSLAEIFLKDVPGGLRTFTPLPFLFLASLALYQGQFRIRQHKIAMENGWCK